MYVDFVNTYSYKKTNSFLVLHFVLSSVFNFPGKIIQYYISDCQIQKGYMIFTIAVSEEKTATWLITSSDVVPKLVTLTFIIWLETSSDL